MEPGEEISFWLDFFFETIYTSNLIKKYFPEGISENE